MFLNGQLSWDLVLLLHLQLKLEVTRLEAVTYVGSQPNGTLLCALICHLLSIHLPKVSRYRKRVWQAIVFANG